MIEIIIITIFGYLCFQFGWKFHEIHIKNVLEKEAKEKIVEIYVEEHDGEFFIFRKEDNRYLAHDKSFNKLKEILNEKFPDKIFNASKEDYKKLEAK